MRSKYPLRRSRHSPNERTKLRQKSLWVVFPLIVITLAILEYMMGYSSPVRALEKPTPPTSNGMVSTNQEPTMVATTLNNTPKKIIIDVHKQALHLYEGYQLLKTYPISTAKNGVGSRVGSNQTPLGLHEIVQKIGDGAPELTVFKSRNNTRQIAVLDQPNAGDLVTSRILWLRGLEPGKNAGEGIDSYKRFIYIHGTAEESKIGTPASHGCIRMKNRDVIELFGKVGEGTIVDIKERFDGTRPSN